MLRLVISGIGVLSVAVWASSVSSEIGSGVAQFPQYFVLSEFSNWHLGHFMMDKSPLYLI
jgi:hypothetical protein